MIALRATRALHARCVGGRRSLSAVSRPLSLPDYTCCRARATSYGVGCSVPIRQRGAAEGCGVGRPAGRRFLRNRVHTAAGRPADVHGCVLSGRGVRRTPICCGACVLSPCRHKKSVSCGHPRVWDVYPCTSRVLALSGSPARCTRLREIGVLRTPSSAPLLLSAAAPATAAVPLGAAWSIRAAVPLYAGALAPPHSAAGAVCLSGSGRSDGACCRACSVGPASASAHHSGLRECGAAQPSTVVTTRVEPCRWIWLVSR